MIVGWCAGGEVVDRLENRRTLEGCGWRASDDNLSHRARTSGRGGKAEGCIPSEVTPFLRMRWVASKDRYEGDPRAGSRGLNSKAGFTGQGTQSWSLCTPFFAKGKGPGMTHASRSREGVVELRSLSGACDHLSSRVTWAFVDILTLLNTDRRVLSLNLGVWRNPVSTLSFR